MSRAFIIIMIGTILAGFAFGAVFRMDQKMAMTHDDDRNVACVTHCLFSKGILAAETAGIAPPTLVTLLFALVLIAIATTVVRSPLLLPSVVPKSPRLLLTIMKRE